MITSTEIANQSVLDQAASIFDRLDVTEGTRQDHKWHIAEFVRFMDGHQLTSSSYLEYKRYLAGRTDLAVTTKNRYLGSASVLLKELAREGLLPRDITLNIHYFQQSKQHKREGITDDEMLRLISHQAELLAADPTPTVKRDWALLALLGLQGLRQIEVHRLDVEDLDLISQTALVQGKGRDDKEPVDLLPQTIDALRDHLEAAGIASGPVFPSGHRGHRRERLTTRAMHKIVTEAFAAAGIERKTPHGLRHWFTTRLLTSHPGDLLEVRRYTRHNSTEMLGIYDDRIRQKADLHNFRDAFAGFAVGGKR